VNLLKRAIRAIKSAFVGKTEVVYLNRAQLRAYATGRLEIPAGAEIRRQLPFRLGWQAPGCTAAETKRTDKTDWRKRRRALRFAAREAWLAVHRGGAA
jgi:hypothetical protein